MLKKPELSDGFSGKKLGGGAVFVFVFAFFQATSGLSCCTRDLHCCMQESLVLG